MENKYKFLTQIEFPDDLRKMEQEQLPSLCEEIRHFIIDQLANNPGHLASSLGAIELTVALHYVFNTPTDRIVWDVGHQAYSHKILTGRRAVFNTNRKYKGISGFPNPRESKYDSFIAGHASNSISAALGISVADYMNDDDRKVIAVIGDGAMTGGLAFEGLNNVCVHPNNLLIILNDNNMSIDKPVGGLSDYLMHLTTSKKYNTLRFKSYHVLKRAGLMNDRKKNAFLRFANSVKSIASDSPGNIFEGLNIRYFGQLDGHDVVQLVRVLRDIKDLEGPKVLHIRTIKGKGFAPAEKSAPQWHAPGQFDPVTGRRIIENADNCSLYQDVFGKTLLELARQNPKIVGITPAMLSGCSMNMMMAEMPDRVFDVGIAEGHAVTFSAGLAKEGMLPYCNIYSSFLQRAYDNIIHDVAILKLPVVLCVDRAGVVGADGVTHQGAFDIAYLRCLPNLTLAAPLNEYELRNMLYTAQLPGNSPIAIRYPRGKGAGEKWAGMPMEAVEIGKAVKMKEGSDIAVLSIGHIGNAVNKAIGMLGDDADKVAWINMRFVKPIDTKMLDAVSRKFKAVLTVEDGVLQGGFGSAVLEHYADKGIRMMVKRIGIPDTFVEHGTVNELHHALGMDVEGIAKTLKNLLKTIS